MTAELWKLLTFVTSGGLGVIFWFVRQWIIKVEEDNRKLRDEINDLKRQDSRIVALEVGKVSHEQLKSAVDNLEHSLSSQLSEFKADFKELIINTLSLDRRA